MGREHPTDIEEIGANGCLPQEFRIHRVFDGDNPYAEFFDELGDFDGVEFLFRFQYRLDSLVLVSEFLEYPMIEFFIEIPIILLMFKDTGKGLLGESYGVEIYKGEEMVHIHKG